MLKRRPLRRSHAAVCNQVERRLPLRCRRHDAQRKTGQEKAALKAWAMAEPFCSVPA